MIAHGGGGVDFLARHFPSAPRPWCDLSTGLNPFAYPHLAVSQTAFTTLPSRALEEACRAAAADYFQADPGRLVLTPGSQAAISAVPRLFAPTKVAVLSPGYGEHAKCWTDAGHAVTPVKARDAGRIGRANPDCQQPQQSGRILLDTRRPAAPACVARRQVACRR